MRSYLTVALLFFAVGATVALACLVYLSVAIGEGQVPLTAMKILFPGILVRWPGMPTEGVTGSMVLVVFVLSTVTNGIIYAVVAVGFYPLVAADVVLTFIRRVTGTRAVD